MSGFGPVIMICVLAIWFFGQLQRIFTLIRYNKEIGTSDYLHMGVNLSMLLAPALYFYNLGTENLYLFLSGFVFSYVISTVSSVIVAIGLTPYIMRYPLGQRALSTYAVFFYMPVTIVMISMGFYLANPFVLGAAFAIASSWTGYIVSLQ